MKVRTQEYSWSLVITAGLLLALSSQSWAVLELDFTLAPNLGHNNDDVFVAFTDNSIAGTTGGGSALTGNTWYSLTALGNANITQATGRVYIELGNQTSGTTFTQPNEGTDDKREYVYYEWGFGGGLNPNADVSYINSFSVPLTLTSKDSGGGTIGTSDVSLPGGTMKQQLSASATNSNNVTFTNASGKIYRVVGPSTTLTTGNVGAWESYHTWDNYMKHLHDNGKTANIKGFRSGNYDLTASVIERAGSPGVYDLSMTGTCDGQTGPVTVVIKAEDMSEAIYGENGPYYVNDVKVDAITNDTLGGAIGDLMAGIDDGFFGSEVTYQGEVIGNLESTGADGNAHSWFMWLPVAFGEVQSNSDYYNTYANVIWNNADSYGTPFGERVQQHSPWVTLADGGTLEITVKDPYALVPEPATLGLLTIGAAALLRKKRK